jgi:hypothetical protein
VQDASLFAYEAIEYLNEALAKAERGQELASQPSLTPLEKTELAAVGKALFEDIDKAGTAAIWLWSEARRDDATPR